MVVPVVRAAVHKGCLVVDIPLVLDLDLAGGQQADAAIGCNEAQANTL